MTEPVKYRLRGGPKDGELVDPPPSILNAAAEVLADALGGTRAPSGARILTDGWVYEFSPDEAGVLVGRPQTAEEMEVEAAFEEIVADDRRIAGVAKLSPFVLAALKSATENLTDDHCVAARRGDCSIFVARGATAKAWEAALSALPSDRGCTPEEVPDAAWDRL